MRPDKLDRDLGSVARGLRHLPDVLDRRLQDRQVGGESDDQLADRIAFQDEWWDLIDRLDTLRSAYVTGNLTESQRRAFEGLCPLILDAVPLISELGLRAPTADTVDAARQVDGRDVITRSA